MKNNLIFIGLNRTCEEDTEDLLRCFRQSELGIKYKIEFGNVHCIKTNGHDRRAPIVARFLYYRDLEYVLGFAHKLKGISYGIKEQFFQNQTEQEKVVPGDKRGSTTDESSKMVQDR